MDIVAEAAKLREARARGAQAAQQARAPGNGGDTVGEDGRGGADGAARPVVEVEAGRSDVDSAARPVTEEGAGGDAQEHPTSQT